MPNFDHDIEVDDFLYECSESDIKRLLKLLVEDGYLHSSLILPEDHVEEEWNLKILKLIDNKFKLSSEDEQTILNITDRLF